MASTLSFHEIREIALATDRNATASQMLTDLPPLDHLVRLTDDTGTVQFSLWGTPDPSSGYTLDDTARALLVAAGYYRLGVDRARAEALITRTLSFVCWAQLPDGRFHNEASYDRRWLDVVGSDDSFGRTVWALSEALAGPLPARAEGAAGELLGRALPHAWQVRSLRGRGLVAIGMARLALADHPRADLRLLEALADSLLADLGGNSEPQWHWFEPILCYDNARLPQALLLAGQVLGRHEYVQAAKAALDFLCEHTLEGEILVPIGQAGWYRLGAEKARYDQQPIDAGAMVECCVDAALVTGATHYRDLALRAWGWFFGQNSEGLMLYDQQTGGCRDGLLAGGVNQNQGSESTVALLQAAVALRSLRA